MEIWKDVVGYEKLFEVSSFGNFRRKGKEQNLSQSRSHNGYCLVSTKPYGREGKWVTFRVHREVCKAFKENPLNKPQVNHIDGVKTNNKVENLEWVTASENSRHAFDTGLSKNKKGDEHPSTKVPDAAIIQGYEQYLRGEKSLRNVARGLGIHHSHIKSRYTQLLAPKV